MTKPILKLKKELQKLIAQGKTDEALQQLMKLSEEPGFEALHEEVLLQSARYEMYLRNRRLGISNIEVQHTALASINQALLHVINQLFGDTSAIPSISAVPVSHKTGSKPHWRWLLAAGLGIITLITIVGTQVMDMRSFLTSRESDTGLQLTVYVHGPKGKHDIVLEYQGQVLLDLRNDRRNAMVGEGGRTNFGEIGRDFIQKVIPLSVQADGYVMAHPDSNYIFVGDPIYLEVKSSCRFCLLSGTVQDVNGRLLPNLVVMVKGTIWADTTKQNGQFNIRIPPEHEEEEYTLCVVQNEHIVWENYVTPNPSSAIEILLP